MTGRTFTASAPGRLDVMGGIADYSGSMVLQMPIRERTTVSLTLRDDFQCNIRSRSLDGHDLHASFDYRRFKVNGFVDLDESRMIFNADPHTSWAAYVIGCALVLEKEGKIAFTGGEFDIRSDVPLGKGVSSSASLEVAVMQVLAQAFGISLAGTTLPILAQRAENHVVGAPCGLMDQLAVYFGHDQALLPILCQPDKLFPVISVPEDTWFVGIDSGVRHAVGGSDYSDVRAAAFIGYSIIARQLGAKRSEIERARETGDMSGLPYQGYLCNIPIQIFEERFLNTLPELMTGREFLEVYGGTSDPVSRIDPMKSYAVRRATRHPVYENRRVREFAACLQKMHDGQAGEQMLAIMGNLMLESHESYSACSLGSDRTDEIANHCREQKNHGIYGARITGGGSGGTVCILCRGEEGREAVYNIRESLERKYGTPLQIFDPVAK